MRSFSTQEAAWVLGTSRQNIWRLRRKGSLVGFTLGGRWRITDQEILEFQRSSRRRQQARRTRPTFRKFAAQTLGRSLSGLSLLQRRIGKRIDPETLAELLREEGRREGRNEMYRELRAQRRLKYPKVAAAARRRYARMHGMGAY